MTPTDGDQAKYRSPKAHLAALGLSPKRALGQNFLADANISARIAEFATPHSEGSVIEIGCGLGALTAPLLERAKCVIGVERDPDMVRELNSRFADALSAGQFVLHQQDARLLDPKTLLGAVPVSQRTIAGNLPYGISGPLFRMACEWSDVVSRLVFLVQLEVAERLTATPADEAYGALSIFVGRAYTVERAMLVKRGAFYPAPRVDSAVVVMSPRTEPLYAETPLFKAIVSAAFQSRRKTLRNAWRNVAGHDLGQVERAAERADIDLGARGETLTVHEFVRVCQELEA